MNEIQYVGESIWIGYVCKGLIYAGFLSAIVSLIAYFISTQSRSAINDAQSWKNIGKWAFIIHGLSIISLLILMFYSMLSHHYEYSYVFDHVNEDLPMQYVFSAFWEGQEGSFLLWMFWHIILGYILIYRNDQWHAPVMAIFAMVEAWLVSMILGIYLPFTEEGLKIGSNPMTLIREMNLAPIFNNADYLSLIKGRGLNPLLQNYWMTIHPPTLFLGFALTLVPFAYAVAALWTKTYQEWLRPVTKWALINAAILGIGILMGSFWAYEALSFGGYWAWDPVENTSLVPWIILIAGVHTNLIANASSYGVRSTFLFYIAGFLGIVYSTLLTRSGILGDTSAHAFTEMGLEWQLTFFLLSLGLIGFALLIFRYKSIPNPVKEESGFSREFWMYIGSLVLLFSGVLINSSSSLPVFNRIARVFDPAYIGRVINDPIDHYNKYQLWIGVFIGLFSAIAVWLQFRTDKAPNKKTLISIGIHASIGVLLTFLTTQWISLPSWQHYLMCFTAWFTISSNLHYIYSSFQKNKQGISASIAHFGFGLMIIGILATGLNYQNLANPFVFKGLFEANGDEEKYIQLIKQKPLLVKNYLINYESDTLIGSARFYNIKFKEVDKTLTVLDSFITRPNAVYSIDFSKVAAFNPDTRHYAGKDIFSCVVSLPPSIADVEEARKIEDSLVYKSLELNINQVQNIDSNYTIQLTGLNHSPSHPEYKKNKHEVGYEFSYTVKEKDGTKHEGVSAIGLNGNIIYKYPANIVSLGVRLRPSDQLLERMLTSEDKLKYSSFNVKQNEEFSYNKAKIKITGFSKDIDTSRYDRQEGDIAVTANIHVSKDGKTYDNHPIFVIRGNAPMSIKDYIPEIGMHLRLSKIDPANNTFEIKAANDERKNSSIPVEIATDVPRTDYLILQAKVFPGINFYWLGTILMMVGLFMGWWFKRKIN